MKKNNKSFRLNKSPSRWPSEAQLKVLSKSLGHGLTSKMLPENATPVQKIKQDLCAQFVRYMSENQITQRALAQKLEVTESRVSEILHYHHERFTIDKLVQLLNRIKPEVKIKVA